MERELTRVKRIFVQLLMQSDKISFLLCFACILISLHLYSSVCSLTFPLINFPNSPLTLLRIFFSSSNLLPLQWTSEYFEVSLSQMIPPCLSGCDECVCFSFSCLYSVYFCFLLSPFSSPLLFLSQENLHRPGIRLART